MKTGNIHFVCLINRICAFNACMNKNTKHICRGGGVESRPHEIYSRVDSTRESGSIYCLSYCSFGIWSIASLAAIIYTKLRFENS